MKTCRQGCEEKAVQPSLLSGLLISCAFSRRCSETSQVGASFSTALQQSIMSVVKGVNASAADYATHPSFPDGDSGEHGYKV